MYEFHGWFGIAESTEESDAGTLGEGLSELGQSVERIDWATGGVNLAVYNGQPFVTMNGLINRRRDEAADLDRLLGFIAARFPGSWGILYERSDDLEMPPGAGAFRVRVMARGIIQQRLDPFLSPCRPLIED